MKQTRTETQKRKEQLTKDTYNKNEMPHNSKLKPNNTANKLKAFTTLERLSKNRIDFQANLENKERILRQIGPFFDPSTKNR